MSGVEMAVVLFQGVVMPRYRVRASLPLLLLLFLFLPLLSVGAASGSRLAATTVAGGPPAQANAVPVPASRFDGLPAGAREIPALRTRTSDTFADPGLTGKGTGGNIAVLSRGSINYKDANGTWQPIDNSLVATTGGFRNKANAYSLKVPSSLADPVTIARGGNSVGFTLRGAAGAPAARKSSATFNRAFAGVTVAYTAESDAVKETLTLANAKVPSKFVYQLALSKGLVASLNGARGVDVRDGKGNVQFVLTAPFMQDAAGAVANIPLSLHGTTLTLSPARAWLSNPARRFPVVVDPSILTPGATNDCKIENGGSANTSFCSTSTLDVGKNSTTIDRSLLSFDTSSIPVGVQVLNAHLDLYLGSETNTTAASIGVYRMTHGWTSSVTWNKFDGSGTWTAGGVFNGTASATRSVGGTTGATNSWYLTDLVQDWVDGVSPNNGVVVKQASETTSNVLHFNSSEAGSNAPALYVNYEARVGDSPQFTFIKQQLDDQLGVEINVANGNVLTSQHQFKLNGVAGFDFSWDSWQNSQANRSWIPGLGWDDPLSVVIHNVFGNGDVDIHLPTGTDALFRSNGTGFDAPLSIDATLKKESDGTYTLTYSASGVKLHFFSWGGLDTMKDKNGNAITLNRPSGSVSSFTDSQGNDTTIGYDANGQVALLTDPAWRNYRFDYDPGSTAVLTGFTDASGKTTSYTVDGSPNGKIQSITDPLGNVTEFTYENTWLGRVTSMKRVTDPINDTGPTWNFSYSTSDTNCSGAFSVTYATDPDGNRTIYCSDRYARVTKIHDPAGFDHSRSWDPHGHVQTSTDGFAKVTTFGYDAAHGNLLKSTQSPTQSLSRHPTFTYTGTAPGPYSVSNYTDEQGNSWDYGYDSSGNNTSGGQTAQTPVKFEYNNGKDKLGNDDAGTYPRGTVRSATDGLQTHTGTCDNTWVDGVRPTYCYAYTSGNLTGITGPLGTESITYDSLNRIETVTDFKGNVSTYTYDDLDRVTEISYTNGPDIVYAYDDDGNVILETDDG